MKIVLALTVGAVISAAVSWRSDPGSILLGIAVIALIWQVGRCMQRIEDALLSALRSIRRPSGPSAPRLLVQPLEDAIPRPAQPAVDGVRVSQGRAVDEA